MSKALLGSTSGTAAPQSEPEDAGYGAHEWERKLAAARQKREALLLQRAAGRETPDTRPVAPEHPGEARQTTIEAFVAKAQSAELRSAPDGDDVTTGIRAWHPRLPAFAAGCAFGAVVVGLLAVTVGFGTASGPGDAVPPAASTFATMSPSSAPAPHESRSEHDRRDMAAAAPGTSEAAAGNPVAGSSEDSAGTNIGAVSAPADAARPVAGNADDGGGDVAHLDDPIDAAPAVGEIAAARPPARPPRTTIADASAPGAGWADLASATPVLATSNMVSPRAALTSRIVVLAPRSVPASARDEAVSALREFGWPAGEPRISPFTISKTHVRFYHPEDRAAAEDLAAMFSAEARDFTDYAQPPERGMLELWLAGRAPVRRHQTARPALPPPVQMVADVLGRLAQEAERLR